MEFLSEFLPKKRDYIPAGGEFIVPIPTPMVINRYKFARNANEHEIGDQFTLQHDLRLRGEVRVPGRLVVPRYGWRNRKYLV